MTGGDDRRRMFLHRRGPDGAHRESSDKGHFRIFAAANVEFGAAQQKVSNQGRDYISVKLDDPSFPAPIYATLVEVEGEEGLQLIWSRPSRD
nr:DUF736 domain-containing protein [Mesorhizobium amorphae]